MKLKSQPMLERCANLQKGHLRHKDTKVLPTRTEKAHKVVRIDSKTVKYVEI